MGYNQGGALAVSDGAVPEAKLLRCGRRRRPGVLLDLLLRICATESSSLGQRRCPLPFRIQAAPVQAGKDFVPAPSSHAETRTRTISVSVILALVGQPCWSAMTSSVPRQLLRAHINSFRDHMREQSCHCFWGIPRTADMAAARLETSKVWPAPSGQCIAGS